MAPPRPLQLTVKSCDSSNPYGKWTFDQDLATDTLLKFIIQTNLPFHAFHNDRFTTFAQECLQPKYEGVSKTTLKQYAFKHYSLAKKDLIRYFQNFENKVSLTIHQWKTSGGYSNSIPFTCVTCHWIDPDTWKMSKRMIALEQVQDVYDVIMSSISEFKIKDKIMSISFDDFEYYTTTIENLKREINPMFNGIFFHTKCACHVLNSMVQTSLDYVAPVIKKFENLSYHIFKSHERKFKKFLREKGAKFFDLLIPHLPQEWNSTYMMLDHMVKQKSILLEYYGYSDHEIDINIEDNDWEIIESLLGILKVFNSSVIRLSDAYYPTTPLVLGEILLISHMFKEYKKNYPFWEPVILEMQSKLWKYYGTIMPQVFTCAAALDPRIGIEGVENILEDIEGLDANNMNDSDYATISMKNCSDALREVFNYYERVYKSRGGEGNMETEPGSRNIIMESVSRKKSRSLISNELELYTKTDYSNVMSYDEYENCNTLEWWRNRGRYQYPIMAEMARDMLTVQASTLGLEVGFCLNGRVLDEEMTWKMKPRWMKMRSFLKEHFEDNEGKQNVSFVDDDDEDVDLYSDSSDDE